MEPEERARLWDPEAISKALHCRGWTKAKVARELGVPYGRVNYSVLTGASPEICAFIAQVIGESTSNLWGWRVPQEWRANQQAS